MNPGLSNTTRSESGFSLLEVMMAGVAVATSAIILSNVIFTSNLSFGTSNRRMTLLLIRNNLIQFMRRPDAWNMTLVDSTNQAAPASFSLFNGAATLPTNTTTAGGNFRVCTGSGYGSGVWSSPPFIYSYTGNSCGTLAASQVYFDPIASATAGFTDGGQACTGFSTGTGGGVNLLCTIQPSFTWSCYQQSASSTTPCYSGLLQVNVSFALSGSISGSVNGASVNASLYNFTVLVPSSFGTAQIVAAASTSYSTAVYVGGTPGFPTPAPPNPVVTLNLNTGTGAVSATAAGGATDTVTGWNCAAAAHPPCTYVAFNAGGSGKLIEYDSWSDQINLSNAAVLFELANQPPLIRLLSVDGNYLQGW